MNPKIKTKTDKNSFVKRKPLSESSIYLRTAPSGGFSTSFRQGKKIAGNYHVGL